MAAAQLYNRRDVAGGDGGVVMMFGFGGPVQIAYSGVELNDYSTQLVATTVDEKPHQHKSFISQLSKHDTLRHHGCYWFLI